MAADPVERLADLAGRLRARGVAADTSRLTGAVAALAELDPADPADVYWAGRLTLCANPPDLAVYDEVFPAWAHPGSDAAPPPDAARSPLAVVTAEVRPAPAGATAEADTDPTALGTAAADVEVLRRRDVLTLTDAEREEVARMVTRLTPRVRPPGHRHRPGAGRRPDLRRTVRAMLRDGGEPLTLARRRRRPAPPRLVVLVDVSGSMRPYADLMLRFAHAAVRVAPTTTEVFTLGTRLTRLTPALRQADPQAALTAAARAVPDWHGGTRLGESLQAFLDLWGQRGCARRAVAVVASDGWERGDVGLLAGQVERLARLARRVVWVNPHRGRTGFAPTARGMAAVLPHLDALVAGHTLEALAELAEEISRA